MLDKLGNIEIIKSSCNIDTIQDGRGAIFTWVPKDSIVEFNLLYFLPNKIRGNHYHPEFIEYFLVVEGSVVMVTKDVKTGNEVNMLASKGTCFRIPKNTPHAVHAIVDSTCISLLSKPWDDCDKPIIYDGLIDFDEQYVKHINSKGYDPKNNK
jgi:dTDP-4-dehydrorhamnose 3,5-epimerase-like enzyme